MESHQTENSLIEKKAFGKLVSYGQMLLMPDDDLKQFKLTQCTLRSFHYLRTFIENGKLNTRNASDITLYDYVMLLRNRVEKYKEEGLTQAADNLTSVISSVFEEAQKIQLAAIKQNLEDFKQEIAACASDPNCPAAYALYAMQQVFDGKAGNLDIQRLVAAKQYIEKISDENQKYQGLRKLFDVCILPAAFLAKKDVAKSAVEYVRTCESMNDNKKMDKFDKEQFLDACEKYSSDVFHRTQGNDCQKRLAGAEEAMKILKALRKTETFAPPKKQSTQFKAKDRVGELLGSYQGAVTVAKQEIKQIKEGEEHKRKQDKADAKRGYKNI